MTTYRRMGRCQHWHKRTPRIVMLEPLLLRAAPSVVTFLGHALAVAWLFGAPLWLIAPALACDVLDGALARRMGVASEFGALYDWAADVLVCGLAAVQLHLPWLVVVLLPAQVMCHRRGVHFSARTILVTVLLLTRMFPELLR